MNPIKIACVGVAWVAATTTSLRAYVFDWTEAEHWAPPFGTCRFATHDFGIHFHTHFKKNSYDWDRSVQAWQSFKVPAPSHSSGRWCLAAIGLQLSTAAPCGAIDLNVYEGYGVEGRLVSSTKLVWTAPYDAHWSYDDLVKAVPSNWVIRRPEERVGQFSIRRPRHAGAGKALHLCFGKYIGRQRPGDHQRYLE